MSVAKDIGEWDYVIAGGGLAGIIVACRLADEGGCSVLLVEAGDRMHSPLLAVPAGETLLLGNPRFDWRFTTAGDPTLGGRCIPLPCGRLLGGSNIINGTLFVRGQPDDYDSWASSGLAGWGWDRVLPYFCKLEDWTGDSNTARGRGGPIRVELPRQREALCDRFLAAALELGFKLNPDYNSGDQEGFGYYQCTQRRGRRHSVVEGYLRTKRRPNLTILTGAHTTRLRLSGRRCTGIEFARHRRIQTARARRETLLCAGVFGSPHVLEHSGIGNPEHLTAAGIDTVVDSPEVGEHLRDHFAARLRWRLRERVSFNERMRGVRLARELVRYAINRRGVLALPIAVGFGFVRSRPQEQVPDLQFHFAPGSYGTGSSRRLEREPGMTIGVYPSRPLSQGSVHVVAPDPFLPPAIRTKFLDHPQDRRRLVTGVRIARCLAGTAALSSVIDRELTGHSDNDAEIEAFVRETGSTSFHPVGTCRMGADALSVVDGEMRVRGVSGLRVIDASIMPTLVSGNTQAATAMIAERGAEFVIRAAGSGS